MSLFISLQYSTLPALLDALLDALCSPPGMSFINEPGNLFPW